MFVEYSGDRYSDCATVTKLCNTSSHHQKSDHVFRVFHAPAHRSQEDLDRLPESERRIGIGNRYADSLAKQALLLHPQASEALDQEVSELIDKLVFAAKVMAKVLCVFPVERFGRSPSGPRCKFLRCGGWHHWEPLDAGRARCLRCLQFWKDPGTRPLLGCKGPGKTWLGVLDVSKGHALAQTFVSRGDIES
eukprot:2045185-Pyramimonas_sp.AAC.1